MDEVERDASFNIRPSAIPLLTRQSSHDWNVCAHEARKALGAPNVISPSLTCNKRLGSNFDRLPREVISEVFVTVVGDMVLRAGANAQRNDVKQSLAMAKKSLHKPEELTLAPLRLSHVCRLWRSVALSTPSLWSYLHVVGRRANITSALELVKLWVPRARARPLLIDVSFEAENGTIVVYPEDWLSLFRVLAKAATLLREASVGYILDQTHFESRVRAGNKGTTPLLEERYLWFYGVDRAPEVGELVPLSLQSSRTAVAEFGFEHHERLRSSLTRLELQDTHGLSSLSNLELQIILGEFPKLERLIAHLESGDTVLNERVVAANLYCLRLSWAFAIDPGQLLDKIVAPVLEELELRGDLPESESWPSLCEFITRSRPPLRTLVLVHFDGRASVSRLADTLALCEHLENLCFSDCILDDSVFAILGQRAKGPDGALRESKVSRLRTFEMTSCPDVNGDSLVEMLALPTQLQELTIVDCGEVLQEHCEALDELFKGRKMTSYVVVPGEPFD